MRCFFVNYNISPDINQFILESFTAFDIIFDNAIMTLREGLYIYMRASTKKIIKAIGFICVLCLVYILYFNFSYYLSENNFLRCTLNEAHESKDYTMCFIGPSTTYGSFVTEEFDELLGVKSINLGSEGQLPCDSYLILKDFLSDNKPQYVVMDVWYQYYMNNNIYYRTNTNSTIKTLAAIRPSLAKTAFGLDMFVKRPAIWSTFALPKITFEPFTTGYSKFYSLESCIDTYQYKNQYYFSESGTRLYKQGMGNWNYGKLSMDSETTWQGSYSSIATEYFNKIVKLCKDNGIELIMVTPGADDAYVLTMGHYDEAHAIFQKLADDNGIRYYDFTYAKPDVFARADSFYHNSSHMSSEGAHALTYLLIDLIRANPSDDELSGYFYQSYEEYYSNVDIANAWIEKDSGGNLVAKGLYGMDSEPEYCFYSRVHGSKNSDWTLLRDYSDDNTLTPAEYQNRDIEEIQVCVKLKDGEKVKKAYFKL